MFSVPGWSLSTSVPKAQPEGSVGPTRSVFPRSNKKRKHPGVSIESNTKDHWRYDVESDGGSHSSARETHTMQLERTRHSTINKRKELDRISKGRSEHGAGIDDVQKHRIRCQEARKHHGERKDSSNAGINEPDIDTVEGSRLEKESQVALTPMQGAMRQKLLSARFRYLNQTLYTTPSEDTAVLFERNPTFFGEYHTGFRQQVASWPENPVDHYVKEVRSRGRLRHRRELDKDKDDSNTQRNATKHAQVLPRSKGWCNIVDLGCGEAILAQQLSSDMKTLNITVTSYDLVSENQIVTKADIAKLPVSSESFDVAIFCLALMGTNWIDFIEEAWRVLRWKGELWVAEIKSRFQNRKNKRVVDHSVGKAQRSKKRLTQESATDDVKALEEQLSVEVDGAEAGSSTDVSKFVQLLRRRGFQLANIDDAINLSNKMFVMMKFIKNAQPLSGRHVLRGGKGQKPKFSEADLVDEEEFSEGSILKPCLYKAR